MFLLTTWQHLSSVNSKMSTTPNSLTYPHPHPRLHLWPVDRNHCNFGMRRVQQRNAKSIGEGDASVVLFCSPSPFYIIIIKPFILMTFAFWSWLDWVNLLWWGELQLQMVGGWVEVEQRLFRFGMIYIYSMNWLHQGSVSALQGCRCCSCCLFFRYPL